MRKVITTLLSLALVMGMLIGIPLLTPKDTEAKDGNTPATMIANRFHRIGFDRYGRALPDGKEVPWQKVGERWWGRAEFPMPFALRAVDNPPNSIPLPPATATYATIATEQTGDVDPITNRLAADGIPSSIAQLSYGLWSEVWLTVDVTSNEDGSMGNGLTHYKHHWYVILDDHGQLWFDADGRFNDCRYYGYADPYDVNYQQDPHGYHHDNCTDNPRALVDPIVSNNTQGPYILDPDYNPFVSSDANDLNFRYYSTSYELANQAAPVYEPRIYFWDADKTGYNTKRLWKLGYADMTDYLAERALAPAGAVSSGIVYEEGPDTDTLTPQQETYYKQYRDWDVGLQLEEFPMVFSDGDVYTGSVLHAENVTDAASYPDSDTTYNTQTEVAYNFGEFIYRKSGAVNWVPLMGDLATTPCSFVDSGDMRLSDVAVTRNGYIQTYPEDTAVFDVGTLGMWEPGDDYDVGTSLWSFANPTYSPTFTEYEYYHNQMVAGRVDPSPPVVTQSYDSGEFIYRKAVGSERFVEAGDFRLTNVRGWQTDNSMQHDAERPFLIFDTDGLTRAGIIDGDLLLMAEVINGGCLSPHYNIAVQTDAWIGWRDNGRWMPVDIGYTAAGIRSQFDTTINHYNRVQKNAMLAPEGNGFFVPSTVFHDIKLEERQFTGWTIWLDDGVDNNIGSYEYQALANPNMPVRDSIGAASLNLSHDLTDKYFVEQTVGGESLEKWDFDYGRGSAMDDFGELIAFTDPRVTNVPTNVDAGPPYMFFDLGGEGIYGVGEHIYRDMDRSDTISAGDLRLTNVTNFRNQGGANTVGAMIQYPAGSKVAPGDLDVGEMLTAFPPISAPQIFCFYDIAHPESGIPRNREYDPGEDIYLQPTDGSGSYIPEVDYRSVRATEVDIQGKIYPAGTPVSLSQALYVENEVNMISMGHNGLSNFMDMEVIPGDIQVKVEVDNEFMVEQTSHVKISVTPEPSHPDDEYHVLLENVPRSSYSNIAETVRTIDMDHPVAHFEITPYRGSCDLTGFVQDRKIYVHVIKEESDLNAYSGLLFLPRDGEYHDPYWRTVYRDPEHRAYANYARYVFDPVTDPRYELYGVHYKELSNSYDCYGRWESTIQPEDLDITANRKCLTVLEQRFPNLILTLTNHDNLKDVNDPAGMRFATQSIADRPHRVNYNARGAGVKFLFTANNIDFTEKYIIQVNDDDTFICWQWLDEEPLNMLSPLDSLMYRNLPDQTWGPVPHSVATSYGTGLTPDPRYGRGELEQAPRLPTDAEPESEAEKCSVTDVDCSGKQATCDLCGIGDGSTEDFIPTGAITLNDTFGNTYVNFIIQTFGVPAMVTDYGYLSTSDPGGQMLCAVLPRNSKTPLHIRVTAEQTIFNFNSVDGQLWPPNGPSFLNDYTGGVDYCGTITFDVTTPDPDVNFAELTMVDHALQYSQANYTAGSDEDGYHSDPISPLGVPAPQIQTPYNPIIYDLTEEVTCYPGGQTHPFRLDGPNSKRKSGWNAYPAIQSEHYNGTNKSQFVKLGTEFFPLTDYGLFFILKNQRGEHLSFTPVSHWIADANGNFPIRYDLMLKRVLIEGPFMRPKFMNAEDSNFLLNNHYNGTEYLPISYDYSGRIEISEENSTSFVNNSLSFLGGNFSNITQPYMTNSDPVRNQLAYPDDTNIPQNDYLRLLDSSLDYSARRFASIGASPGGANDVFAIDEIIPVNYGNISITVELHDGTRKVYQDCCIKPPVDGIDVHGLDIQGAPSEIKVDQDNVIEIELKEYSDIQVVQECNNALVFCWQDRGIKQLGADMRFGVGDGWITNPPRNSNNRSLGWQYLPADDLNGDSKISFNDFETEILGTYDMITNTWSSGIIDARTYQRNDGAYKFELTQDNGCIVDEIGFDFGGGTQSGGRFTSPDHIISQNEELPVWITAYKYGDDNNDRSFQPYYEIPPTSEFGNAGFSHEVYLAATKPITVVGESDLVVETIPTVLTAGVTPEYVDPDEPFTFQVYHEDGATPFDFVEEGVPDWKGEYRITDVEFIANNGFVDPRPDNTYYNGKDAELRQRYWLRFDLHNYDGTSQSEGCDNHHIFASKIEAIDFVKYDFSKHADGLYSFRDFVANDEGSFPVYIYSPDRKHYAKHDVKVRPPQVVYEVNNVEGDGAVFTIPSTDGDADFILTAANNNMYKVRVTCKTWDGEKLLKGTAKGVSVCSGSDQDVARFTPAFSTGMSFYDAYGILRGLSGRGDVFSFGQNYDNLDLDYRPRMRPRVGLDLNANGVIDPSNNEFFQAGYFKYPAQNVRTGTGYFYMYDTDVSFGTGSQKIAFYYNTTNRADKDPYDGKLKYEVAYFTDIIPRKDYQFQWGAGSIYNSTHLGGYVFADFNDDGRLSYADSLSLDDRGQTELYITAEDVQRFTGLVGDNPWSNSKWGDVYGGNNPYLSGISTYNGLTLNLKGDEYAPRTMKRRYGYRPNAYNADAFISAADGTFKLDWEAFPAVDNVVKIESPKVAVFSAESHTQFGREIFDSNNFDIVYSKDNHVLMIFTPADRNTGGIGGICRDIPLMPGAQIRMHPSISGGFAPYVSYARTVRFKAADDILENSPDLNNNHDKAVECVSLTRPTGVGRRVLNISYTQQNTRFIYPHRYYIQRDLNEQPLFPGFDSVRGLQVIADSESILTAQTTGTINIKVVEFGTNHPAAGAELIIEGAGVSIPSKNCNDKGETSVVVTPTETGVITIKANLTDHVEGVGRIVVGADVQAPTLAITKPTNFETINDNKVEIEGTTRPGSTVTVNGEKVSVDLKGKFKYSAALENEGSNTLTIKAMTPSGATTVSYVTVIRDLTAPELLVNEETGIVAGATKYTLTGKVEPGSTVTVNGEEAIVVFDVWTKEVNLVPGENTFNVEAMDSVGNVAKVEHTVDNYNKVEIEFVVGNSTAYVDGVPKTMSVAPTTTNASSTLMVDAQFLFGVLGDSASSVPNGATYNIKLGDATGTFTIDGNNANIGGTPKPLSESPTRDAATNAVIIPVANILQYLNAETDGILDIDWNPAAQRMTITRLWK